MEISAYDTLKLDQLRPLINKMNGWSNFIALVERAVEDASKTKIGNKPLIIPSNQKTLVKMLHEDISNIIALMSIVHEDTNALKVISLMAGHMKKRIEAYDGADNPHTL